MKLYMLFGLPGAGKTFVGTVFLERFGFTFYEGDNELSDEMRDAISTKTVFTDEIRDAFFDQLIARTKQLQQRTDKLVISQTFIKEKYREKFLEHIPAAKFIYIDVTDNVREERLRKRIEYPLDLAYARKMVENFEKPRIPHAVIVNNSSGKEAVSKQIAQLLSF